MPIQSFSNLRTSLRPPSLNQLCQLSATKGLARLYGRDVWCCCYQRFLQFQAFHTFFFIDHLQTRTKLDVISSFYLDIVFYWEY